MYVDLRGLADGDKVVYARTIHRKPEEERWNKELIMAMKGSPSRPDPTAEGIEIPIRIRFPNEDGAEPAEWRKIKRKDYLFSKIVQVYQNPSSLFLQLKK